MRRSHSPAPAHGIGSRLARWSGVARSLAMYHGIPFRAARLRRLYAPFVDPGALCFDIGAHAGSRTRCWRRLGARVIAVEPQAEFARLLQVLYGRDPGVTVLREALGSAPGRARLLVSERTPTVTTLSRAWIETVRRDRAFEGLRWSEGEEVEVTTLESLIARFGRPQFVKIDVEGFEAEVLAGLATALPALSFEYVAAASDIALECIDRLSSLGEYRFNWSAGEGHRLGSSAWLDAEGIVRFARALPGTGGSGDIYACLERGV